MRPASAGTVSRKDSSREDSSFDPASIGLEHRRDLPFNYGLPKISVGGFSVIGATAGVPRQRVDTNWHFIDNYSWKIGRHDFKFGYEFRRTTIQIMQDNNFRGKLSFRRSDTSFLEGIPSGGSQASGNTNRHEYENNQRLYVQDSFRWTSRLTLNFGLRWDYFGVPGEKNNLFYRLLPPTAAPWCKWVPQADLKLYDYDYNNFAPRIGFAYDLSGKGTTVIRGG